MPDPREALIKMVEQDMRRSLRQLPKEAVAKKAWVVTAVSHDAWNRFYPPLSLVPEEEDIKLFSLWNRDDGPWVMEFWCVVRATPEGYRRLSSVTVSPFGLATVVSEDHSSDVAWLNPDDMVGELTQSDDGIKPS